MRRVVAALLHALWAALRGDEDRCHHCVSLAYLRSRERRTR